MTGWSLYSECWSQNIVQRSPDSSATMWPNIWGLFVKLYELFTARRARHSAQHSLCAQWAQSVRIAALIPLRGGIMRGFRGWLESGLGVAGCPRLHLQNWARCSFTLHCLNFRFSHVNLKSFNILSNDLILTAIVFKQPRSCWVTKLPAPFNLSAVTTARCHPNTEQTSPIIWLSLSEVFSTVSRIQP